MTTVFSGIQPTGDMHLGNYVGAISQWLKLQKSSYNNIYCIVNLHAITVYQDPKVLYENTLKLTAFLLACGIDINKSTLFVQSHNVNHCELAWIFNCVARIGWLNRMTQFKEKAGKNRENNSVGLFAYPNLQAADILLYDANLVPVGDDQKQHIELCRDIAQKFNTDYKSDCFILPEPMIIKDIARIMSLQNGSKKMSKSDPSENGKILFSDSDDDIAKKVSRAKTDSLPLPNTIDDARERPEALNLLAMYSFCSEKSLVEVLELWSGKGFKEFKESLSEKLVNLIAPIRDKQKDLYNNKDYLIDSLKIGADKAMAISQKKIDKVKELVGFVNLKR